MTAYNLLYNDDELVIELYEKTTNENEQTNYKKSYEFRLNKEESQKLAGQINRIANMKMAQRKDKLMQPKPTTPTPIEENMEYQ